MSALKGIIVLDLSRGKSGAVSSMFLADNGARVIRVLDNSNEDVLKICLVHLNVQKRGLM